MSGNSFCILLMTGLPLGVLIVDTVVEKALALGIPSVKLNCVVMRGVNDREVADFVALTLTKPIEVRFIE